MRFLQRLLGSFDEAIRTGEAGLVESFIDNNKKHLANELYGYAPLAYALLYPNLGVFIVLLNAKADKEQKSSKDGLPPLVAAVNHNMTSYVDLLLFDGAEHANLKDQIRVANIDATMLRIEDIVKKREESQAMEESGKASFERGDYHNAAGAYEKAAIIFYQQAQTEQASNNHACVVHYSKKALALLLKAQESYIKLHQMRSDEYKQLIQKIIVCYENMGDEKEVEKFKHLHLPKPAQADTFPLTRRHIESSSAAQESAPLLKRQDLS